MSQQSSAHDQTKTGAAGQPMTAPQFFTKGDELEKAGQIDQALAHFRFCLSLDPGHLQALFRTGNLLISSDRVEASLPYFKVLTAMVPHYVPARVNYAIAFKRLGKLDNAIEQLEAAAAADPAFLAVWQQLADVYRTAKQPEKSRDAYQRWADLAPDDPKPRFMLDAMASHLAPEAALPARAPDDFVAHYFDQYASTFDNHAASVMRYQVPAMFKRLVDHLGFAGLDDINALDLGCGTGLCGAFLAPISARLDGIDLSPAMIAAAKAKGYYSSLIEAELVPGMKGLPKHHYDIILAGDVFCYIGDLEPVFAQVRERLSARGRFIFSVEAMTYTEGDTGARDYTLRDSGRDAHHRDYIHDLTERMGIPLVLSGHETLRLEFGKPVSGWVLVAQLAD